MTSPPTRDDRLLDGRLLLRQPVRGHRSGTDALLLAAAVPPEARDVIDLGAGVGAVGLAVALQAPDTRVRLVELDAATAALARHNVVANVLADRVGVVEADILARRDEPGIEGLAPHSADVVLTNPPFDEPGRTRPSPDAGRRRAHVMDDGGLNRWILAALDLLRPGGTLVCIHRATMLPALLKALDRRFGAITVRPVAPRAGSPALRVLVKATAGSRGPFALLPPLVLHREDGAFTPDADDLHRGRARLPWT